MKIELVSHACIQVENKEGKRLLTDPWLVSPVFFSSWYLCPEPKITNDIFNKTNYIYLTHWHFDHFDYKSLRKFDKKTKIFVPKFPSSVMKKELEKLGFHNVCEMIHKKEYKLSENFSIISLQVEYHDDSILIIKVDGKILINLNDAKPLPNSWKWLKKNFINPEFMFRSHSIAWSFPTKYKLDQADKYIFSKKIYFKEYMHTMNELNPKYSIPFASYVCHLHKENFEDNNYLITPYELNNFLKDNYSGNSKFVIMNPGGKYSLDKGFYEIENYDLKKEILILKLKYETYLENVYEKEKKTEFDFEILNRYFQEFFKSIRLIKFTIKNIIWFFDIGDRKFKIDFYNKKVEEVFNFNNISFTAIIKVHKNILQGSLKNYIFSNIDISKRWNVQISKGNLQKHLYMTALISIFEGGILPLEKNLFNLRFFLGYLRRLPEIIDYLTVISRLRKSVQQARDFISGTKSS